MGEFDLSLISEFRSRPSFYDRNSPRFKDKLYNAREWQGISNKLGFDVSILKDRILQLRNRYNLEKRRIEQLKEENPTKHYESPWPLYEHLHFLSDHIRARRSYKKLIPLNGTAERYVVQDPNTIAGPDLSNSCSNNSNGNMNHSSGGGGDGSSANQNITAFPNGLLAVKMEDDSDETEDETESQNNSEATATAYYEPATDIHSSRMPQLHPYNQQQRIRQRYNSNNQQYNHGNEQKQQQLQMQHHKQQQQQQQQQTQQHPTISIRRLDTLRSDFTNTTSSTPPNINNSRSNSRKRSNAAMMMQSSSAFNQPNDDNDSSIMALPINKKPKPSTSGREFKYTAFGNFVSSSLMDLPPSIALELVEKFTSDVVKALMEKAQQDQHS